MSKFKLLKKEQVDLQQQKEELHKLMEELSKLASEVVADYKTNPSEISGSVVQVHEKSPYLVTKEERLLTNKKNDTE